VGVGAKPLDGAEVIFDGSRAMLDERWTYWQGPRFGSALPIKWKIVEDPVDRGGTVLQSDDPAVTNMRLLFEGDRITLPDPTGGGKDRKKAFSVAPAKSPKAMDMASLDGQEKGQTAACIYKLDGDRLTICMPYFTADPSRRPTEFKAGGADGLMLITLERVKPRSGCVLR
jgi:uncharacterized protein (TIGR03067 family)